MIRSVIVSVPPVLLALTLDQARTHLRLTKNDEDLLLRDCIEAATLEAERFLNRALVTQTIELRIDHWPADGVIPLPRSPVQSVVSVAYRDEAGAVQPFAASNYHTVLLGDSPRIVRTVAASWPGLQAGHPEPITVTYTAGYGLTHEQVPALIRAGILFLTTHLFEQRNPTVIGTIVAELPFATERCWASLRNLAVP